MNDEPEGTVALPPEGPRSICKLHKIEMNNLGKCPVQGCYYS